MDLQTVYGNFLRKSDVEKAKYQYNRPYISLAVSSAFVFALVGAVITGGALAYAYFSEPVKNYDSDYFSKAQALNTKISKNIAMLKTVRPDGIDVCEAVSTFQSVKPEGISLENIKVQPGSYEAKGRVQGDIELVNKYASALKFAGKEVRVADISNDEKGIKFTITARQVQQPKKPKAQPEKGGQK